MNLRPPGYEPDELPDCSTPRYKSASPLEVPCYISTYQTGCQELFQLFLTPLNAPSGSDVQARPFPWPSRAGALKAPLDNTAINPLLFLIERKSTTRFGTRYPLYRTIRKYNYSFFAKVVAWDASGIPTVICSKWGPGELIQSTDYNPFGGNTYGHPKRYYKQTN